MIPLFVSNFLNGCVLMQIVEMNGIKISFWWKLN
jgi:hypothetical protein